MAKRHHSVETASHHASTCALLTTVTSLLSHPHNLNKSSMGIKRPVCVDATMTSATEPRSIGGNCVKHWRHRNGARMPSLHKRRGFNLTLTSPISPPCNGTSALPVAPARHFSSPRAVAMRHSSFFVLRFRKVRSGGGRSHTSAV